MQDTLFDERRKKPGRQGETGQRWTFGQLVFLQADFTALVPPNANGKASAGDGLAEEQAEYRRIGELSPGQLSIASAG